MHYEKSQIDDTSFKTHEHLKIFEQPDSQLLKRAQQGWASLVVL